MTEDAPIQLVTAARSDPGRDPNKQANEDAFRVYQTNEGLLAIVCDGMGGHIGGRLASNAATQVIELEWRNRGPSTDPRRLLGESIQKAAAEVYALGGDTVASERPGSTCVAAWLSAEGLYIAHVGDSRAYRYRSGRLYPLTLDHSVVEAWVAAGQLTREQAKGHPDAHRITRALGIAPNVEVELRPSEDVRAGDRLLLCSDGLTDLVADSEIAQWLGMTQPLEAIADALVNLANARGGHDNITAVLVEILGLAPAATAGFGMTVAGTVPERTQTLAAAGQPAPFPKTVAIDNMAHTVLMDDTAKTAPLGSPVQTPQARHGKTLPFAQTKPASPLSLAQRADSVPPERQMQQLRAQRKLWIALGVGLLLSVLAILVRLLRHKSG